MPRTTIKIKMWKCECCNSTRDSDPMDKDVHARLNLNAPLGVCHQCLNNKTEPKCGKKCKMKPANDERTITVEAEEYFDTPDMLVYDGAHMTAAEVAEQDQIRLLATIKQANRHERLEAVQDGRAPVLQDINNHNVTLPERHLITTEERKAMKAKVKADIAHFTAIKDNA